MVTSARDDTRWERWGAIGGILFVVALVVVFLFVGEPPQDATAEELAAFYEQNEVATTWVPYVAITVGGLGFLWFLGSLVSALRRAEAGTGRLSAIATVAGGGALILLMGAAGVFISTAFSITDPTATFELDVSTEQMVTGAGFGLFAFHLVLAAALVVASSVVAIRTAMFPKWFGWVGILPAVVLLIPPISFFIGIFAFWLWILIASGFILAGRTLRPPATGAPRA